MVFLLYFYYVKEIKDMRNKPKITAKKFGFVVYLLYFYIVKEVN